VGMFVVDRHIVMVGRRHRSKWFEVVCFGAKRHYRKDGTCKHAEAVIARVKPRYARRAKIVPFGGKRKH
jgi:hypothetical protein